MPLPGLLLLALLLPAAQVGDASPARIMSAGPDGPRLELRFPATGRPRATLLMVHGGSWTGGSPDSLGELATALAARGYASVCTSYALAQPGAPSWPRALHDLRAAARWIRGPGRAEGLAGPLVALGVSAGAQLALLLGTDSVPGAADRPDLVVSVAAVADFERHVADLRDAFPVPPGTPGSPVALFLGGAYGPATAATYREASPVTWVTPDDPPCLLLQGLQDPVVEPEQALLMDAALDAAGVPSLLLAAPGSHGMQPYGQQQGVARLLGRVLPALLGGRATAFTGEGGVARPALLALPAEGGGTLLELLGGAPHRLVWLGAAAWPVPPGAPAELRPCLTDAWGGWSAGLPGLPAGAPEPWLQAVLQPGRPRAPVASAALHAAGP